MKRDRLTVERDDCQNGCSPTGPQGRTLRILVVEDDAETAEATAEMLRVAGYEVQVARDGVTALQIAQADLPEVILLDLGLPGIDGYEVARRLREEKVPQRPLLIAVTGHAQKAERLRSYEVGIDLHLTKPVSFEELRQYLQRFQTVAPSSSGAESA